MATGHKIDLMPTTYTKGVGWSMYDRAERIAIIRGVGNNANHTALQEAVDYIQAQAGTVHHTNGSLPLQRITARKRGSDSVMCVLDYFRRRVSILPTGFAGSRFRGATRAIPWYRIPTTFDANGRPSGQINFAWGGRIQDEEPPPKAWQWDQQAVAIHVPFFLTTNPIGVVAGRLGTTNNSVVGFGGFNFPINAVRFDAVTVDVVEDLGVIKYEGSYDFLTVKGGFVKQFPFFDYLSGPPVWTTIDVDAHPKSDFLTPPFPG